MTLGYRGFLILNSGATDCSPKLQWHHLIPNSHTSRFFFYLLLQENLIKLHIGIAAVEIEATLPQCIFCRRPWSPGTIAWSEQIIIAECNTHHQNDIYPEAWGCRNKYQNKYPSLVLTTVFCYSFPQSGEILVAHFTSLSAVTGWVITQIQFAFKLLCCLLCSCVFLLTKSFLFLSMACDQYVSLYSPTIVWWEGAMNGQDATLTKGERKLSHSSLTWSWKEMGTPRGRTGLLPIISHRWGGSVEAPHWSSLPLFQPPPLWHSLWPVLAVATVPSC